VAYYSLGNYAKANEYARQREALVGHSPDDSEVDSSAVETTIGMLSDEAKN
jgi:hypothetical protein